MLHAAGVDGDGAAVDEAKAYAEGQSILIRKTPNHTAADDKKH